MEDNLLLGAGWQGHDWIEPKARIVKVATGYSVVQRRCARCRRDFITTPSGERNAVFVSIISFFLLDGEVTDRWVNLACPGRRLPGDDDDRERRIAELVVFHKPETLQTVWRLRGRGSVHSSRSGNARLTGDASDMARPEAKSSSLYKVSLQNFGNGRKAEPSDDRSI